MTGIRFGSATCVFALTLAACSTGGDDPIDGEHDGFPQGKADGAIDPDSADARAVLALANDPEVDFAELDDDAGLNRTAVERLLAHRDGADGDAGTADDDLFDSLAELDAVPFIGKVALSQLLAYAIEHGYREDDGGERITDVIFSPQPAAQSHNARVAQLIGTAEHTLDIAMYSFSDAGINAALAAAVDRGVEVRFLFETASEDRKLTGTALQSSKSGRLEQNGIDVRWVNKIMHHKFMIVDGPRDSIDAAAEAFLVSGSGNWSNGAATIYDENTVFLQGHPELVLRMQQEFEHLWTHSRDFVGDASLVSRPSELAITDEMIEDGADEHAFFTSANFDVTGDTFSVRGRNEVADALVLAIEDASESIHVSSGHLRLRSVAQALIAKAEANPDMDIRVYLDGQEYIAETTHEAQVEEVEECLVEAGTSESKIRACNDKGFLWGFIVGESGVDVRYKYYAYRWHASYAKQMHNKYMIIDGDELWTGSYNLSDNAEHNTFENMLVFRGADNAELVAQYEANFEELWETGRAEGLLAELIAEIDQGGDFPIVFDSMALEHAEIDDLKDRIRDACPAVNSEAFRTNPVAHQRCE